MAEKLGELSLDIRIDWKKVNASLKRVSAAVGKVSSSIAKKVGSAMRSISTAALNVARKTIGIFTDAFKKIVQIIKRAMIISAAAITGFLIYSTKLAIDVEETESLFEHSFGNMAKSVRAWSDEYSKSVKANKYDSLDFLSTIFNMTKSMGLTEEQAIKTSKEVVKIANDLKSAYNLKGNTAFEKIRSGLAGQPRPLMELGILVGENTVKQYAYANGIAKAGKELTDQQKVLARMGKILEATSTIQGDMIRTLDSTQNRLRALKDGFKEYAVAMGNVVKGSKTFKIFLTAIENTSEKVKVAFEKNLINVMERLDKFFANETNRKKITAWLEYFVKLGKWVGQVFIYMTARFINFFKRQENIDKIVRKWKYFKSVIESIILKIKELKAKVEAFLKDDEKMKELKKDWENFKTVLKTIVIFSRAVSKPFILFFSLLLKFRKAMLNLSKQKPGRIFDVSMILLIGSSLKKIYKRFKELFKIGGLKEVGKQIKLLFKSPLKSLFPTFIKLEKALIKLANPFKWVGSLIRKIFFKVEYFIVRTSKGLTVFGKSISRIGLFFNKIWTIVKAVGATISNFFMSIFTSMGLVTTASAGVVTALSAIASIVGWLSGKGLLALNDWLVKNVEWFGNLQRKLDDFWASVLDKIPLWKRLFGVDKDPNAEKAAQIRAQKAQNTTVPSPATVSNAYKYGTSNKAMLAKLDALIFAVNNQPAKQNQLDRMRI